jgi:hypothetical protein
MLIFVIKHALKNKSMFFILAKAIKTCYNYLGLMSNSFKDGGDTKGKMIADSVVVQPF